MTVDRVAPGVSLPSGTVTFLFSDIEGSTQRWETQRLAMQQAVARHDEIMRSVMTRDAGFVFKTVGDAFCVAFSDPAAAAAAALDAQKALAAEDFAAVGELRVRMALHTGTAQERDADYFGPTVNRVARLLATGHGGQVLVSSATGDLLKGLLPAQASLQDLGEHQLRDLVLPERVYQLNGTGGATNFPPLRSLDVLPNNLPRQTTPLIGRETELAEIKALLGRSQVVTLLGTGGIGKTRAALQAAADLLDTFTDGVWLVDLAPITTKDLVVAAVGQVFSLQTPSNRDPLDELRAQLKNKRLLLLLDNCEHVVEQAAAVVAAIIRECPGVAVLATSREMMNIHGEQTYRMPSLSLPPPESVPSAGEALRYGAIALFVARATAADARFVLTDEKVPVVAGICKRLDGIALAIELAAARANVLNLKQLAERLNERFRLLTGGDRTALPRQQTMRATIEWSYDLLSEHERSVFRRLAVFQGGWTLAAAIEVCCDETIDEFLFFDILSALVNKSLVAVEAESDVQRYRFLESLREYAAQRLQDDPGAAAVATRHAEYFWRYGRQAAEKWNAVPEIEWLSFVSTELDNIREALRWFLQAGNDVTRGAQLAEPLWPFWFSHAAMEGRHWLEQARQLITPQADPALSVALDLALSRVLINFSFPDSVSSAERALAGARLLDDDRMLSRAAFYVGEARLFDKQYDEAEPLLLEARELARRSGDRPREAGSLQMLGRVCCDRKQFDQARTFFAASRRYYEARGADHNHALALLSEANLERSVGNLDLAIELARASQAMGHALRDRSLSMLARAATAICLVAAGRLEEAKTAVRETIELSRGERVGYGLTMALQCCVDFAMRAGQFELAGRLFGFTQRSTEGRLPENAFMGLDPEQLVRAIRESLGDARCAELVAEGSDWPEEQGLREALALC